MCWEDAAGTGNVVYSVPSHEGRPGRRGFAAFMVLLRRWPLPVLAATVAVCGLVMASGAEPLPLAVLVGVACYLVASRVPRRVSIAAVAVAAAALGAALGYAALARTGGRWRSRRWSGVGSGGRGGRWGGGPRAPPVPRPPPPAPPPHRAA